MSNLRKAVRRWIKAEWAFRLGPRAYWCDMTAMCYLRAADKLRVACTGTADLKEAAKRCGISNTDDEPSLESRTMDQIKVLNQLLLAREADDTRRMEKRLTEKKKKIERIKL